jgi:hypothetical protein
MVHSSVCVAASETATAAKAMDNTAITAKADTSFNLIVKRMTAKTSVAILSAG